MPISGFAMALISSMMVELVLPSVTQVKHWKCTHQRRVFPDPANKHTLSFHDKSIWCQWVKLTFAIDPHERTALLFPVDIPLVLKEPLTSALMVPISGTVVVGWGVRSIQPPFKLHYDRGFRIVGEIKLDSLAHGAYPSPLQPNLKWSVTLVMLILWNSRILIWVIFLV